MEGGTGTTAAQIAGQQQGAGRGSTGWSALTEAVKMFGPAAITQELLKKLLNERQLLGGEPTECATFKMQAAEAVNLRAFVGMVKGDVELKKFILC